MAGRFDALDADSKHRANSAGKDRVAIRVGLELETIRRSIYSSVKEFTA